MTKILLLLLFALPLMSIAQTDTIHFDWKAGQVPDASETKVQLTLWIVDLNNRPVKSLDLWLGLEGGGDIVYHTQTDRAGKAYFLLPRGQRYLLSTEDEADFQVVKTHDRSFVRSRLTVRYAPKTYEETVRNDTVYQVVPEEQMPTASRVLLLLTVTDFDGEPHEEEQLFFTYKSSPITYVAQTNAEGIARLMLPKGDSLYMHTMFERELASFHFPNDKRAGRLRLRYRTIGTKAILAREAERKRQAAIRDSLAEIARVRDSLDFIKGVVEEGRGLLDSYRWGASYDQVERALQELSVKTKQALAENPQYFEEVGYEVNAALYRHRELWSDKVIVTDMTGSMSPYLDQVLLWHALAIVPGEHNQYVLFNDGDRKPSSEKVIGATGGIYRCQERDIQKLLEVMKTTMAAGSGGESPENDVEALIEATTMMGEVDELILIADNYSDVRDLELLTQLRVPVRIVLAGVRNGVNEDYLHLAYMTGGSIHTLEEDLFNLTHLNDGETISIGGYTYRVSGGQFLQE
jgi:hypothetical protein